MTRVRKVAAVSLMAPAAAGAIAFGLSRPADAAEACPPLASATINAPTGTVAVGSTVHVSAQISGLMLLQAHLQVTGPGLDQQVGKSVLSGPISGNVTVPNAGQYTLAVVGNGTKCTYKSTDFTAKERAAASPTHSSAPGKSPQPGGAAGHSGGNGAGPLPKGAAGGGVPENNFGLPQNGASPYSLPPVAPDGSAQGFTYPTPEPQVASPPAQPQARNVAETTPIKWGQSLAIALVLLVISAHLGMWSRRQRLAAEGARSTNGGGSGTRRRTTRRKSRGSATIMAATATATATATESADTATAQTDLTTASPDLPTAPADAATSPVGIGAQPDVEAGQPSTENAWPGSATASAHRETMYAGSDAAAPAGTTVGQQADAVTEPIARPASDGPTADDGRATATTGGAQTKDSLNDDASARSSDPRPAGRRRSKRSGGRGYHGRRRRD